MKDKEWYYWLYEVHYTKWKITWRTAKPQMWYYDTAKQVVNTLKLMLNDVKLVELDSHQIDVLDMVELEKLLNVK